MNARISIWSNGLTSTNCYRRAADAQPPRAAEPRRAVTQAPIIAHVNRTKTEELIMRNASAFSWYANTVCLGCKQQNCQSEFTCSAFVSISRPFTFCMCSCDGILDAYFSTHQWYVLTLFLCRKMNRCVVRPIRPCPLGIVSMVQRYCDIFTGKQQKKKKKKFYSRECCWLATLEWFGFEGDTIIIRETTFKQVSFRKRDSSIALSYFPCSTLYSIFNYLQCGVTSEKLNSQINTLR